MDKHRTIVSIAIKPYLKSFFLSLYPDQDEPVFMPKRDRFNERLAFLLSKPPPDFEPDGDDPKKLYIMLPYFEHLDTFTHTYLSPRCQTIFCKSIQIQFLAAFVEFMLKAYVHEIIRYDGIRLFLEKYNIPHYPYIEDMLSKIMIRHNELNRKFPTRHYTKQNINFIHKKAISIEPVLS